MGTARTLARAAFFTLVSISASKGIGQVVHYGNCPIDLERAELPECAISTVNGHLYVKKRFAGDVFSGRVSGIAANPISVSGKRLASTMIPNDGWAYFDRTGLVVVQHISTFDSGADVFHYGLVSVNKGSKWGLADSTGRFIVPMRYDRLRYDDANSTWLACTGCQIEVAGEHSWFTGGSWVRINVRGKVTSSVSDPNLQPNEK